jgi:hypothetical protein
MLCRGQHGQHRGAMTVGASLSSAEDAFAILPQNLEAANSTGAQPREWIHLRIRCRIGGRHSDQHVLAESGQRRPE